MSGQGAYETSAIDKITGQIRDGRLPAGQSCMVCGTNTSDVLELYVQCESKWMKGPGTKRYLFVILTLAFLPFWILWVFIGKWLLDEERQELGRERGVSVPLRICADHQPTTRRRMGQRKLRRMMSDVPVYADLFDEFPNAKICS